MPMALHRTLARWRAEARAIVTDPASTESQRRLAWRFLRQWGATA